MKDAINAGDMKTAANMRQRIEQSLQQQQEAESEKQEEKKTWERLLKSGFFKGIFMVLPAVLFGSFTFLTLKGLSSIGKGTISLAPEKFAAFKAKINVFKKGKISQVSGENSQFSRNVREQLRKPSDLDSAIEDVNNAFKDQQESEIKAPPLVDVLNSINYNPGDIRAKEQLASKFNEIRINNFFEESFKDIGEIQREESQVEDKRIERTALGLKISIGDDNEGLFPELDKDIINYIHSKLFDPDYDQNKPKKVLDQIIYRSDLILEAREVLKSTRYNDLEIFIDEIINPDVLTILQEKFNKGEEWSKLERVIADVASFYLSGQPPIDRETHLGAGGDTQSDKFVKATQAKKDKLKQLIYEQLQHYSKTGERLYTLKEIGSIAGWVAEKTTRKYASIILIEIFTNPDTAKLVHSMIFGLIFISYQGVKKECIDKGYKLLTSSTQWFEMMKDRVPYQRIYVEVECVKEGHRSSVRIDTIQGCYTCALEEFQKSGQASRILDYQDILGLAESRGIQAISFNDDFQQLTETEFNHLLKEHKAKHQDPDDYMSRTNIHIKLRWRHPECGFIFEQEYYKIQRAKVDLYCPKCVSSIDQRQTFAVFEEVLQGYASSSLKYDIRLSGILPNPSILLQDKYESIRDPRVHVDMFGVFVINGQEIKIAIEHQGSQHTSFASFLSLNRYSDEKRGIYKSDSEYREAWDRQVERDRAKVELFEELNRDGYYLIVVDYSIPVSERAAYILQEFMRQTGLRLGQSDISDWI